MRTSTIPTTMTPTTGDVIDDVTAKFYTAGLARKDGRRPLVDL